MAEPHAGLTVPLPPGAEGVQAGAQGGAVGQGSRGSRSPAGPARCRAGAPGRARGTGQGRDRCRSGGGISLPCTPRLCPVPPCPGPGGTPRGAGSQQSTRRTGQHPGESSGSGRSRAPCRDAAAFPQHGVSRSCRTLGLPVLFRTACTVRQHDGAKSIPASTLWSGRPPRSPQCTQTLSSLGWGGCRVRGTGWRGTFPCHPALGELVWEAQRQEEEEGGEAGVEEEEGGEAGCSWDGVKE